MASSENVDHLNNSPEIHQLNFKSSSFHPQSKYQLNWYFLSVAEKPTTVGPHQPRKQPLAITGTTWIANVSILIAGPLIKLIFNSDINPSSCIPCLTMCTFCFFSKQCSIVPSKQCLLLVFIQFNRSLMLYGYIIFNPKLEFHFTAAADNFFSWVYMWWNWSP